NYQLPDNCQLIPDNCKLITHNYSYFPIFISEQKYGKSRDQVYEELKTQGIYARRYFYPLISDFPMYSHLLSAQKNNVQHAHRLGRASCRERVNIIGIDVRIKIIQEK